MMAWPRFIVGKKNMRIDICLPVKNEAAVLKESVEKILQVSKVLLAEHSWRLIVAVNDSQDNSFSIASQLAEQEAKHLMVKEIFLPGKGRAIKSVWQESEADVLVFLDADLSVNPELLNVLLSPILKAEADLVIGSRFLPGSFCQRSWQRGLISWGYIFLAQLFLGARISDLQCGFKAITKIAFQKIKNQLWSDGWFFDTELVLLSQYNHMVIKEVPIVWRETRYGQEKSRIKPFQDSCYFVANLLRLRRRLKRIKKKYRDNV